MAKTGTKSMMNVKTSFLNPHSKGQLPSVPIPESWNPLFTTTTIKTKASMSHKLAQQVKCKENYQTERL